MRACIEKKVFGHCTSERERALAIVVQVDFSLSLFWPRSRDILLPKARKKAIIVSFSSFISWSKSGIGREREGEREWQTR